MSAVMKKSIGEAIYKEFFSMKFGDKSAEKSYFELIYLGQNGNSFHIGYREYTGNTFRGNFSENFIFEVPGDHPTEISYKSKNFSVLRVTNKEIEFKLL